MNHISIIPEKPISWHSRGSSRSPWRFTARDTHGHATRPDVETAATSEPMSWCSMFASIQRELPGEREMKPVTNELLVLFRSPAIVERWVNGRRRRLDVPKGAIIVFPSGKPFHVQLHSPADTVHLYLKRHVLEKMALEIADIDPSKLALQQTMLESDPVLAAMIETVAVQTAHQKGSSAEAFFIASAIAAHLIPLASQARLKARHPSGNSGVLSPPVARAIAFMRDNLDKPLTLEHIATASFKSQSQIARLVRQETGRTTHKYLVELRAAKSKELLERTNVSIAEVACACGFASQEHLTRTFRQLYGETPAAYRKSRRAIA